MIPPYQRTRHRVNFRPASNFRQVYNYGSNSYQNMMYQTMPQGEQNVKKEEEKSNEIPKESEEGSKANEDGPKDPRIRNKK